MELKNPKVSVIVAIYNAEKYLKQCLESIIGQTLKDIEIICVNDGSTDSSLSILNKYASLDSRIKIYTKENEGLGGASARNYGLDIAKGEYISILDSDDFFEFDMLEKAYERAINTKSDIVIFGGSEYNDVTGNVKQVESILNRKCIPLKNVFSYKDCSECLYQLTQGMAWNKLFNRKFVIESGIRFQRIKYTDDAYFTFSLLAIAKRMSVLDENLCFYRVNTGISQTDGLANYPDSSYKPYLEIKETLIKVGNFNQLRVSFLNCATTFIRYFYDKISDYKAYSYLHNKLREEVFEQLGIVDLKENEFEDYRVFEWVKSIQNNSPGELAFKAARAYGNDNTTGILRFGFPYNKIPRGAKIALIGAGILGRSFCAQILLNSYCDIVCWIERSNEGNLSYIKEYNFLKECTFDFVVIAFFQQNYIDEAIKKLEEIGISREKIVIGN